MLTREEDVDAGALRRQGWSISAIARHLGRDRKTVRAYLAGERIAGLRSPAPDAFLPFQPYCRRRLMADPHLWATTLFAEVVDLGYRGGYSTFTRALRRHRVRPACGPCCRDAGRNDRAVERQPASEVRFAWLELPDSPEAWGLGAAAHLLVGTLVYSGRWRGVFAERTDFPHTVEALDRVLRRLHGTGWRWRFERTPAVCCPETGAMTAAFAGVAKYYGVSVDIVPPRVNRREEAAERAGHSAARRWWRTLPPGIGAEAAQRGLDEFAARMDGRCHLTEDPRTTAGGLLDAEPLVALPHTPFPALADCDRVVGAQALVPFRGNSYGVPPGLADTVVSVRWRLDEPFLSIATASGAVVARHVMAPRGAERTVRDGGRGVAAVSVPPVAPAALPCRSRLRRPSPDVQDKAEAPRDGEGVRADCPARRFVVDLFTYADVATRLRAAAVDEARQRAH